ncbi:hypothetical protein [Pantoea agglomerans]|uniref:hypothetical protein n=1 Tax=Enterobacter agglomerans TaxID=549 RepID=UPI0010C21952|nr:hypothetical protein [Pantoea agglomerans]TKK33239.1 hypothetical protein PagCFBP13532_14560 [Pantoea agglomerans]
MTEEQKQALIEHIETDLELLRNVTLKHCHEVERECVLRDIEANEIALAALTTPEYWKQRAEAAEAIVSDVNEIIGLLSEREWAEHCTKTETGKLLEELITELHDDASPASGLTELVPDEIPGAFVYHGAKGAFDAGKSAGWNACRDEVLKNIEERESEKA